MIDSVRLEDLPCPLGCRENDKMIMSGSDLLHGLPGEFTIVKCCTCGLMRTNPRPTPEGIGVYYPDDYGPYVGTLVPQSTQNQSSIIKKLLKRVVRQIFKFNTNTLPQLSSGRLLEVGCASGIFLHQMVGQGWQVEGVEFSAKAAMSAAELGYRVHAGPLETAPEPSEPFDLIVGWMVLEHLHDPINCLKKLREWAKPDAWLVLSVPNSGSFDFRLFKEKLYSLHLPNHLYHFTPQTIEKVLEASGWTLSKVHHQRVLSNIIASTGYVLHDKGFTNLGKRMIEFPAHAGKWHFVLYPLSWLLSAFGQTGRMTIWARKRI
ncbi:class I SAM-dependent methyltransferase [Pelotalea chapellei]|uniref:Class I SAM-dependent methyltransferase n=1 Tax=Pelotalea chapellei TaxID=44671 RepID=A0ABS5U5N6_9BACT|nr:class I SAM-dependent methyltransferase [Pelotalea chapellei]MBT1070969.1 class I SAM-dependent methyltransferase [Pelotalea chapellei]